MSRRVFINVATAGNERFVSAAFVLTRDGGHELSYSFDRSLVHWDSERQVINDYGLTVSSEEYTRIAAEFIHLQVIS